MKYLILIHTNPAFQKVWEGLSEAQRLDIARGHKTLTDELIESGEQIAGEGLADPSQAKCVSVRNGRVTITDGPYAEAKEHLVGFYLLECESMERALEYAARVPDAAYGEVEVRPVLDLSVLEL